MNLSPESSSFSDEEIQAAAEAPKCQTAFARAAGARHRARLIDQLASHAVEDPPAEDAASPP